MTFTKPAKWGDLGVRTASALVLIPAVIAADWLGGIWFGIFVFLLAALIGHEWTGIVHPKNPAQYALHLASAFLGTFASGFLGIEFALLAILGLAFVSGLIAYFGHAASSPWRYLGVFYAGLPALAFVLLRVDPDYGFAAVLWIFLIVWAADTLAYFAGRLLGGPRLAPRISPKKTWAGLAGAVLGSALASVAFAHAAHLNGVVILAAVAGCLAIVEQAGDLFESALKRFHGVKDSGSLIPGHGGIIDRVDGLIAVVVVATLIGLMRDQGDSAARGLLHW